MLVKSSMGSSPCLGPQIFFLDQNENMAMITVTTFVPYIHNVLRPDPPKVPNRGGDSNKFPCPGPVAIIVREVQGRAKTEGRHGKREKDRQTSFFYIVLLESAAKGPSQFVCEQE